MIRSMTGFGRAESSTPCGPVRVEIKTLNHKFFDFSPKLPPQIQSFEERIRKTVQARVGRGKIYLSLLCPDAMLKPRKLHVDEGLAREHLSAFRHLRKTLRLRDEIRLSDIVRAPDVLSRPVSVQDVERTWRYVGAATRKALDALEASRRLEGEVIFRDVMQRGRRIRRLLAQIVRRQVGWQQADLGARERSGERNRKTVSVRAHVRHMACVGELSREPLDMRQEHEGGHRARAAPGDDAGRIAVTQKRNRRLHLVSLFGAPPSQRGCASPISREARPCRDARCGETRRARRPWRRGKNADGAARARCTRRQRQARAAAH